MNSPSQPTSYLTHLNGLRGIAILAVLLYHLNAAYCPAGYFGVDLFLVISGFLLLRSLLKPGAGQGFSYGSYLLKKAWRIIPAWFVVTLLVCIIAALLIPASRVADFLKTARTSAFFYADYQIDNSGDYFNVYTQQNPFLHFWYLSITMQLYIVAPLLVIPLARWCSRRAAVILLLLLSLLSLAYYVATSSLTLLPDATRHSLLQVLGTKSSYYHLIPRFWEICAGAAVLILPEWAARPRLRACLGALGLAGLLASFWLYSTGSQACYLSVVSSLLALRYGSTGLAARLLGSAPLQKLGTISFSLYLWHWPVMVFWKYCCFDEPGPWGEVGMVLLSLLLGILSWWGIERIKTPSRPGVKGAVQRCALLLCLPLVVLSATQLNKYVKKQSRARLAETAQQQVHGPEPQRETDAALLRGLEFLPEHNLHNHPVRLGVAEGKPRFIYLGDSHADQLRRPLHAACSKAGVSGLYLYNKLLPHWNLIHPQAEGDTACWNEKLAGQFMDYLRQQPDIRYVVIAQWWEYRFRSMPGADWRTGKSFRSEEDRMAVTGPGLGEFCDRVRALGKEVVLLGDNPSFRTPSPLDEWERYQELPLLRLLRPYRPRVVTPEELEAQQSFSLNIFRQLQNEGRAHYIELAEGLKEDGVYPAEVNGHFLYSDTNHLSEEGAGRAVEYFMPRLLELLRKAEAPETEVND